MAGNPVELTALLADWRRGNQESGKQLMTAAYEHLRRLAANRLRQERAEHTLQATELVSELYLKLFSSESVAWHDRVHFFAVAARQLRRILIDHARAKRAEKRGGNAIRVSLTAVAGLAQSAEVDVLQIDELLTQLEALDPRAAAGVELRFFGGLTDTEIVEVLGISPATLYRDWRFSRAWLISRLMPKSGQQAAGSA